MMKLCVVYESGKRYILPAEFLEGVLDKATLEKLRTAAVREIQKL